MMYCYWRKKMQKMLKVETPHDNYWNLYDLFSIQKYPITFVFSFFYLKVWVCSRYDLCLYKGTKFRDKWYNCDFSTYIQICMIFEESPKMRFPSSTKICRMAAHPRSPNCFRSFSKDFGEDFTCHSIFSLTKKDLGVILVHMRKYEGPNNLAWGTRPTNCYTKK